VEVEAFHEATQKEGRISQDSILHEGRVFAPHEALKALDVFVAE